MTTTADAAPDVPLPRRLAAAAETDATLGRAADRLRPLVRRLVGTSGRRALLRGAPLGHAAHPLLTDVPIGLWLSATTLDVVGPPASHAAADRLLGTGVLAAIPTALTGWADWDRSGERVQRVGTVHAALNAAAVLTFGTSWLLRRRGHRTAGVALSLAATAGVLVSGYLGGHMTLVLKAPPDDRSTEPDVAAHDTATEVAGAASAPAAGARPAAGA
ncbi:DUF2231 domain-containing protein [Cellulomonas sp. URHB0016]